MNGNLDNTTLLNKILDQLIQLFDLSARIDAKTHELETEQRKINYALDKINTDVEKVQEFVQDNKIKISNLTAVRDEIKSRREKRFNWILSIVVIVLSTLCSYLLYLLGVRP